MRSYVNCFIASLSHNELIRYDIACINTNRLTYSPFGKLKHYGDLNPLSVYIRAIIKVLQLYLHINISVVELPSQPLVKNAARISKLTNLVICQLMNT